MSELMDLFTHLGEQLRQLFGLAGMLTDRFKTNLTSSITMMDAKQWIRLVIIVGAYALARPFLLKLGAKAQAKQFEKDAHEDEAQAQISPNALRGDVGADDDEDEDDKADTTSAAVASNWGKKARRRQRTMIKKILDDEERRLEELQEDDEDQDIAQYLVG